MCSLAGGDVRIHRRIGGEADELETDVGDGLAPEGLVAYFPIPIARAWDNVHRFCASTLVFRSAAEVDGWCRRHGYRRGDVQPLSRVRALASRWYGGYLAEDWRKWTLSEARAIFSEVGLDGLTWELPAGDGEF